MARISEQTIEHIRSTVDILDVVGRYVQLKKRGHNYFGLCPFHLEKTPSFAVNPGKQIYKCFGCGAGGGAINFIMAIEKLEFVDSIKFIGDQYGIEVNIEGGGKPKTLITQLYELQKVAAEMYQENLKTEKGKMVVEYFHSRGLNDETIAKFKLGYSTGGWSDLLDKARSMEMNADAMIQCGLFINGEKGYFDRFRNRIMFPISDRNGKVAAFAGRIFEGDDPAKYVNSSETPIYNKSGILYGLSESKSALSEKNTAIVVEGYLDYLQLYQAGIQNVVAVSGTAFTDSHAAELKKYVQSVKIAYDGDSAGKKAAVRAGYVLLRNGFNPEIIPVPEGMDPDDWVQKSGTGPLLDAMENSINQFHFHFDIYPGDKKSPAVISSLVNEILFELTQINDGVHRELCVKELASVTGLNERTLFESLQSMLNKKMRREEFQQKSEEKPVKPKSQSPYRRLEDELIQTCFAEDSETRKLLYENVNENWLHTESIREIYNQLYIHLLSEFPPDINVVMDGLINPQHREKLASLVFDIEKKNLSKVTAIDCLRRMEKGYLKQQVQSIREQMRNNISKSDETSQLEEIHNIQKSLNDLRNKYQDYAQI